MKACITHSFACDCREEKFKQLEAENAELKNKINWLLDEARILQAVETLKTFEKENEALKSRIEKLREALEFYASLDSYYINGRLDYRNHISDADLEHILNHYSNYEQLEWIGGRTARAALKADEDAQNGN